MSTHHIIDRRKNQKGKSSGNRRRFIRRVKNHVKEAARKAVRDGDIKSITSSKGRTVNVPVKDLKQHNIRHGDGGVSDRVFPGNKEFAQGDRILRPPQGGGGGGGQDGSPDGEGEDSFTFELTKEEFLDLFFEDLELPDLIKKNITVTETFKYSRAGYVTEGTPARLNILRSLKQSLGRVLALSGPMEDELDELLLELAELEVQLKKKFLSAEIKEDLNNHIAAVKVQIKELEEEIDFVPFVDDVDLRYNFWKKTPQPTTQAAMFCIMDVSASMGEWEKEMSKRFFMLLYLFLTKTYERVEIIFIRHHVQAKEVDEDEFFHSRETGGTTVSPALDLMKEIIIKRYPVDQWNIYGCQASDGDNFPHDTPAAVDVLQRELLHLCQYYAYVEIDRGGGKDSDLWDSYNEVKASHANFDMTVITEAADIYPVFRRLFESKKVSSAK